MSSKTDVNLLLLGPGVATALYLLSSLAGFFAPPAPLPWILALALNLLGYATVLLPLFLVVRHTRSSGYLDTAGSSTLLPFLRLLIRGGAAESAPQTPEAEGLLKSEQGGGDEERGAKKSMSEAANLMICGAGLLGSYSIWGYLQEKIMTTEYTDSLGNKGKFHDSQFLVFVNRILAFAIALIVIVMRRQPRHKAPLFKYSYCSLSNILSSWCQYEALKYISFPTQVLAKASKVIPVMLMGKVVSKKKYEYYEYLTAVLISFGMVLFLLGSDEGKKASSTTTFSGVVILFGYMAADAFTSNWQGQLFQEYKMSSIQMMAGVNLFSCLLTSV